MMFSSVNCIAFLLFVNFPFAFLQAKCPLSLSVDLSDPEFSNRTHIIKNNIVYTSDDYYYIDDVPFGCICKKTRCIRKCCPPDEIFVNNVCNKTDVSYNFTIDVYNKKVKEVASDFHFLYNKDCNLDFYRLLPEIFPDDVFFIQKSGLIYFPTTEDYMKQDMFCVENFLNTVNVTELIVTYSAIVCFPEQRSTIIFSIGM